MKFKKSTQEWVEQALHYAYWHRGLGMGRKRTLMREFVYYAVGGGSLFKNKENIFYVIHQRWKKDWVHKWFNLETR